MHDPEKEQVGLPFALNDYYDDTQVVRNITELIELGKLPFDTMFRLASVGYKVEYGSSWFLNYHLMLDMAGNFSDPTKMRSDTRELLYGDLPDAIVDINSKYNYPAYPMLDPMYYRMMDLAKTIHRRREANGVALPPEQTHNPSLRLRVPQEEVARCIAIARPIWRLIVKRTHPEWLEKPADYFQSTYIGAFCRVYDVSERQQIRGIISHAVLSDPLVLSFYEEAVSTGIVGIGKQGKEDLRLLLSDEHPELLEGHELPASDG